jgi:23S rRNA (adenine2503-C2)-methyltransferase
MTLSNLPKSIYDLDPPGLEGALASWGEPTYRAKQIWQGLYQNLWDKPEQFTNLPKNLRDRMFSEFSFANLRPEITLQSHDGETTKALFRLPDDRAIETVLMRYSERRTLCISTQAGCAMGCVFCATGQMGFQRHLTSGEIVEQVLFFARQLNEQGDHVTNIVVMGMGEPFHNYVNTLAAIDRLNDPQGFNLGARHFTISTVGLVPLILRFAEEKRQVNLAISLHAANDAARTALLPINKKYPLNVLLTACRKYVAMTHRRITFEWALIRDVNDSPEVAVELARKLKGLLCHVNVIPLNPTERYPGQATTRERAEAFKAVLEEQGIACTIRIRRGIDIQAGCGQLADHAAAHHPANPTQMV